MRTRTAALAAVSAVALAHAALASETTTYSYDALGRLVGSSISGGPNGTRQTGTCFDPAGNRVRRDVATSAPSACPAPSPTPTPGPTPSPTPTPTPTPTNQPPIAVDDVTSFACSIAKTVNLVANDSDPDNNLPLSLVSITPVSGAAYAAIVSSTSVVLTASATGTFSFTYTVSDSLGATDTGTLTVTVTGNNFQCIGEPPV